MYAITGITGQVGGTVARRLLAAKLPVRAVVRDAIKGAAWAERGCEVAVADMNDNEALGAAHPAKVVCLSTIGAQVARPNLLTQLGIMEQMPGQLPMPIVFLRAGWFMENSAADVAPACMTGVVPSFLQPLDKPVPMVATADIGRVAAELLQECWSGRRVIELEGPHRVTRTRSQPHSRRFLAVTFAWKPLPRERWEALFTSQGMKNPLPRVQMLDCFNEGWI